MDNITKRVLARNYLITGMIRGSLLGIALVVMMTAIAYAGDGPSKEIYSIASQLSTNGSQLAAIGSKIEKTLSTAKEGSRDQGYLMIAIYEIKTALLATGLSGQLIGASQLVRQEERNSYFPRLRSTLENVSLSALVENKQFFDNVLQRNILTTNLQDFMDAKALIEDSMRLIKNAIKTF